MKETVIKALKAGNISRIKRNADNRANVDIFIFNPVYLDHTTVTIPLQDYRDLYLSVTGRTCMF